jgi:hypothetical protein
MDGGADCTVRHLLAASLTTLFVMAVIFSISCLHVTLIFVYVYNSIAVLGGAVCWGNALQAGRSRVRFPTG